MTHEAYMQVAIKIARQTHAQGGVAIGAVLVNDKTGEIIASGSSSVSITHDPTSHAEVICIRNASQALGTDNLNGHTLYGTLEPCMMCLSTATWARIPKIYFGAYRKDVDASLFDIKGFVSDERQATRMNLREDAQMQVHGGILEAECAQLLQGYHDHVETA
ncbi:MAG TPA: nucleoside deaminase [Candidatus Saccharimonadales bacterium]|nr:nucleoside deaminase [Candidatus Saccharimonadales bacterium]